MGSTTKTVIRLVLDTNILISTALPGSRLRELVEAWQKGRCRLLISPEIFDEYLRVFAYPKFGLSMEEIRRILEHDVWPYAEQIKVTTRVTVITADPSDNKFLACAVDGRADYIVSGDHHLLDVRQFQQIPIISARQFLTRLSSLSG